MTKNRAAIYARFSSHNQRSESIDIQVEQSRKFCDEEGLKVVATYCDYAQTGRTTDRAQFQKMMQDAQRGLFDYVVIYKVTRIMRNRDEMSLARIMLRRAGVEILYAGEQIASGSSGVLQLGMLEVLAEWESAIDSERIRDGIQKNAQRCMANGRTLYGWDIVDGRYRVNEKEAAVLRRMKNMLISGHSVADIVRAVSSERSRNGKPFNQDTVTKLLKRVQNGGTYKYAGHEVPGGMPELWSRSEQDMVLSILGDRHRPRRKVNTGEDFPLTGKLYCTHCGCTMAGTSGTSSTGQVYTYYKCRKCRRTVRQDLIEDVVHDMTMQAVEKKSVRQRMAATMSACSAVVEDEKPESYYLKKDLKKIDDQFARIWKAIEDGIAPPGGRERTEELVERKNELEAQLAVALANEEKEIPQDDIEDWLTQIAKDCSKEDILREFVRAVEIDRDEIRLYFEFDELPDDFDPTKKAERRLVERRSTNSLMVELMRKTANSTSTANRAAIQLDTCIVRVSKNWFVVVGTCQK